MSEISSNLSVVPSNGAKQFRFSTLTKEILLLQHTLSIQPFASQNKKTKLWEEVAVHISTEYDTKVSGISCQRAFKKLLDVYKKNENSEIFKSGIGGDYEEKQRLLTELSSLYDVFIIYEGFLGRKKRKK